MKPYYKDASVTIYHGDCRELIPQLQCDLVVTSPPYNLGNNHHTGSKRVFAYDDNLPEQEYQDWQVTILCLLHSSCSGDLFYNHKNRIKQGWLIRPDEWIRRTEWRYKQEIVWVQGSQNFDKCRFYPFTERIYWLSKQGSSTQFKNVVNLQDVWNLKPVGSNREHARAFPIEIPLRLIQCCNSSIILDPFMGSGTTLRAAKDLGRKAIGIDISEQYCEQSARRMEQESLQLA